MLKDFKTYFEKRELLDYIKKEDIVHQCYWKPTVQRCNVVIL
jgi:hypothetical protein